MLKNAHIFSSFSVKDLAQAKEFYSTVLGLEVRNRAEGLELHIAGGNPVFLYPSATNRPADFTVLNFLVEDIRSAVEELRAKGITMEHYDMPGIKTDAHGIAWRDSIPRAAAWFKDPSGNILALLQEN